MAFMGTPVVTQVSQSLARITGIKVPDGGSGTISLNEGSGEVKLPDGCNWGPYGGDTEGDKVVTLDESVEVSWTFSDDPGGVSGDIYVQKSGGSDPSTFLITILNSNGNEQDSGTLDLYFRFHN